jgi:hypothetical protein
MSMKSQTMMPPRSRSRICRAISLTRLEVGLERDLLEVEAVAARLARVDVDGDQRLGLVEHDRATRGQVDAAREDALEVLLDAVGVEQRPGAVVELHALEILGRQLLR